MSAGGKRDDPGGQLHIIRNGQINDVINFSKGYVYTVVELRVDPTTGQYTYVWKTQKSWAGTCRQFTLRLTDGTDHIALFMFK